MQQFVFEPLRMTRTTVPPQKAVDENAAAPHALDICGHPALVSLDIERFADSVAPAGAAWSTVRDIARYLSLELTREAAADVRRQPQTKIDGKSSYGLGLLITKEYGLNVIGHPGHTLGFSSDMFFLPDQGIGAVVLTNMKGANAFLAAVRQRILELVFGAPPTSEQMVSSAVKSMHVAIDSMRNRVDTNPPDAMSWLERWLGQYDCNELGEARIIQRLNGYRIEFES
jgi:CubicO group peptidase (beta-lactamase class C family)